MSKLKYMFGFLLLLVNGSCTEDKIQESGYGVVKGRVVKAVTFEPIANVKVSSNPNNSPKGCTSMANDVFNRKFETHSNSNVNFGCIEV